MGSSVGSGVDLRTPADGPLVAPSLVSRCPEFARRLLLAFVTIIAAACVVASLVVIRSELPIFAALPFSLAAAAVTASQLARVGVRVGRDTVFVGWGEVAVIVVLCLLPPVWLPLVGLLGSVVAHLDRLVVNPRGQRLRAAYAISGLTIAYTVAAVVASFFTGGATRPLQPGSLPDILVFILAGTVYFGVTSIVAAAWMMDGEGLGRPWRQAARGKRFVLPGNLAIGTAVAVLFAIDPRWLVTLVPIFALMHRAYVHSSRADERWDWWERNLIAVTRGLGQAGPAEVATSALRGAHTLFGAVEAEVGLRQEAAAARDTWIWYAATEDGAVSTSTTAIPPGSPHVLVRPLVIGKTTLGEMRLRFDRSRRLDPATELVFSTYAYAVANALSDAATHHNLQVMVARTAFDEVHDPLTGLSNRSVLVARGDAALARRQVGAPAALILLDVDSFREVNDTLGPAAGDELLQSIASRLDGSTLDGEILARLGGDEFALLLAPEAAVDAATERASEVLALVASPVDVAGVTIAITATIGVGLGFVGGHAGEGLGLIPGVDTTELMRRAGVALRQARRRGVAVSRYADVAVPGADRHTVLADLRDALATTGQLRVVVQPVVSLATGAPVSAEVLVRWHHPTRGLLLPGDFLAAVEGSELAGGLTRHVVDMALAITAGWSAQGIDLPVTVNLCARCTLDPQLPMMVVDRLAAHGVPADRLILEITESVMVDDPERVEHCVGALRQLGVQVSVGDFGTALASLELLARCRVDEVKIDRTFVAAMTTSPETAAIVSATVKMARELDIRVVAEAVELPEQRDALNALGVRNAQGHLFYPPLSPADATEVVTRLTAAAS